MTVVSSLLAAAVCLLPSAFLQAKPDFSGSWKQVDMKVTPPPADTAGALPPGITVIRQTATTIAIEREAFGNPIVYTFALDGSESKNASGAMTMTTRTRWEGDRLVTEGTSVSVTSQGRSVWKIKEVRYFDARKAHIVERSFTDSGGAVTSSRQVLERVAPPRVSVRGYVVRGTQVPGGRCAPSNS